MDAETLSLLSQGNSLFEAHGPLLLALNPSLREKGKAGSWQVKSAIPMTESLKRRWKCQPKCALPWESLATGFRVGQAFRGALKSPEQTV